MHAGLGGSGCDVRIVLKLDDADRGCLRGEGGLLQVHLVLFGDNVLKESGNRQGRADHAVKDLRHCVHEDRRVSDGAEQVGRNYSNGDAVEVEGLALTGLDVGVEVGKAAEYATTHVVV
jgi:hypothetical protein